MPGAQRSSRLRRFHGKIPGFLGGWTGGAEAGGRKEEEGEMREEGLVCGGPERTCCLALFQGQGCSTQPARRKRKEGRKEGGWHRENMFPWLGKEDCWKGRGALGPGENNSVSHGATPGLQAHLHVLACLCSWLAQWPEAGPPPSRAAMEAK